MFRGVQINTAPQFEAQQRIDQIIMIVKSLRILPNQPPHVIRIKKPSSPNSGVAKQVIDHPFQIRDDPGANRRTEASLLAMQNMRGEQAIEGLFKEVFS